MKTLDRDGDRHDIERRLGRLTAGHERRWGSLDVGRMIVHVDDATRIYLGEIVRAPRPATFHPARYFPLKQLVIYLLPFPKGVPTSPESLERQPTDFETDRRILLATIDRFCCRDRSRPLAAHGIFGPLGHGAYARLAWRHLDHHLRQFGE